jgi:hypothetical protein
VNLPFQSWGGSGEEETKGMKKIDEKGEEISNSDSSPAQSADSGISRYMYIRHATEAHRLDLIE